MTEHICTAPSRETLIDAYISFTKTLALFDYQKSRLDRIRSLGIEDGMDIKPTCEEQCRINAAYQQERDRLKGLNQ